MQFLALTIVEAPSNGSPRARQSALSSPACTVLISLHLSTSMPLAADYKPNMPLSYFHIQPTTLLANNYFSNFHPGVLFVLCARRALSFALPMC